MARESGKVKASAFLVQGTATLSIAFLTSLIGFVYAWPSYTMENFQSNQTVLTRPMTTFEVSLFTSLVNVGALVATPFCGYAIDRLGRKYSAMLFGLPFAIAWAIISVTTSVPLILTAMAVSGFGAAGQAVTSVYISEVAQDSIRGALMSSTVVGYFIGLLLSYAWGGYLSYQGSIYVHLALSVLYIGLLMMLKESPVFLLQKGKLEDAKKSIAFYRQVAVDSKEVEAEIAKLRLQLDPRINEILEAENDPETSSMLLEKQAEKEPITKMQPESAWQFLKKSHSSQRALVTAIILMAISILMGPIVLQPYAEEIFTQAVPGVPANLCSILMAVDFLVASLLCGAIVDRCGRKCLMTSTCALSALCNLVLGSQLQLQWAPHWVTAFIIYFYCFVYNLGAAVVPFIVTAEVFLPEVRSLGNSLIMAVTWMTNFTTLFIFGPIVRWLGLGPVFYIFTVVCLGGSLFSQLCLPETKGLAADEIQKLFMKKEKRRIDN